MKRVYIIHDPYKLDESTVADVENPLEYLKSEFKDGFPEHAKIYKGSIAVENDITEKLQKDELLINLIDDDIWVVIWPAWIQFVFYAVVALTAALSVYMYLTMPQPTSGVAQSPNNEIQNRRNTSRLNGRIPDIFGTVLSFPDLIAEIYTYYENGIEIEECLLAIGRGSYEIHSVKDGNTNVEGIDGVSVSIYEPNSSLTGSSTIYRAGTAFTSAPRVVRKSDAINGQSLVKPNELSIESNTLYFMTGGVIRSTSGINFSEKFKVGDGIAITGAQFGVSDVSLSGTAIITPDFKVIVQSENDIENPEAFKGLLLNGASFEYVLEETTIDPETQESITVVVERSFRDVSGQYVVSTVTRTLSGTIFTYEIQLESPKQVNYNWNFVTEEHTVSAGITLNKNTNSIDLDDSYTVSAVSTTQITLANSSTVNPDWAKLPTLFNGSTQGQVADVDLDIVADKWVGWFNLDFKEATQAVFNLYAPQGFYSTTDSGKERPAFCIVKIEYQMLDENLNPVGEIQAKTYKIEDQTKSSFGRTVRYTLPSKGSFRFRLCKDRAKENNRPVTEVKIKSVYATYASSKLRYPDVTTVRLKTVATDGALSVKERKLNCLLTRKLPINGTGSLVPTNSAAQALIYLALDQKNGRRSINEVDIAQILAEEQAVISYFGNAKAAEFSYTLDDDNLSFEEIAGMVASSMFCEAYRYGNKLRARFEQPQQNSVLLFNAANKAPNTEKRTKVFASKPGAYGDGYDGIEIEYTSPDDDTRITYIASDNENPINTMQIKTSGIRSHQQAKTRAWREWNKLKYRNITCEFEALEESELLARNDRILVADNTVIKTKDGIIDHIDGLTLGLSHPIESNVPYFIYLQLADGRIDIVPCSYADEYAVLLSRPPLIALVPEFTTYQLIESTEAPHNAFMVTEIRPQGKMTNMLTCVNYDERYYQNDADFF